jgi:uncharacterized peroxidase-related enzyme
MPRITPVEPAAAGGRTSELLAEVQSMFGVTPNLFRAAAASDAALEGLVRFFQAIGRASLEPGFVEQIALAVSEVNGCSYCLSAHTHVGRLHNVSDLELTASRRGSSSDPKKQAALVFAQDVVSRRGGVFDADFDHLREVGWADAEIAEILTVVGLTTFTNLFAVANAIEIDFPVVRPGQALAA